MLYHIISGPVSYQLQNIVLQSASGLVLRSAWQMYTYSQIVTVIQGALTDNNWQYSLYASYSLFLIKMNCKRAQIIFQWIFISTGMNAMSFRSQFEIFLCFVLGKCSVNCPQAGREAEGDKWGMIVHVIDGVGELKCYLSILWCILEFNDICELNYVFWCCNCILNRVICVGVNLWMLELFLYIIKWF